MTVRRIFAGGALVLLTALVTSQVVSQDKPEKVSEKEKQMWAAMARYGSPGEYHKHLNALVGDWTYTLEWWEYPGGETQKDTGTVESMWVLGGRFVLQHVMGDEPMSGGGVFEGHGCIGYDNFRQEYTSAWISNMQTSISTKRGSVDATGKTFTFWGTHDDIMTGERDKPAREIIKIVDHNTHTVEWFQKDTAGEEFKSGQLVFTRKTKGEGSSGAARKQEKKYRD